MTKTMYSLILTDAVIEKIDRMAYEKGISRSQMIDHLLAREVGLSTPEQKTRLNCSSISVLIWAVWKWPHM